MDSSINAEVSLAACAERCAKFRTSSATTANPIPASPARAASTAALSARMLVWKAISSITLMIFEILSLEPVISCIDWSISSSVRLPSVMRRSTSAITPAASFEFSAFLRVIEVISSLDAEVSSSDAACSEAPWARV